MDYFPLSGVKSMKSEPISKDCFKDVDLDINNWIETKIAMRLNNGRNIPILPKISYAGEPYIIPDKEPKNES